MIVPGARVRELCAALDTLLPDYPICGSCLRPRRSSLPVYILPPFGVIATAALPLALGGLWKMAARLWGLFGRWWLSPGGLRRQPGRGDHPLFPWGGLL